MAIKNYHLLFVYGALLVGCDRADDSRGSIDRETSERPEIGDQAGPAREADPDHEGEVKRLVHDLGTVLCDNRTIRHVFSIANDTSKPIGLIKDVALVPCCSSVGEHPKIVPPGGIVEIPVFLKTVAKSERKRVEFLIQTDSPDCPAWRLELLANWSAREELAPIEPMENVFVIAADPGRWIWKVTIRRAHGEKPSLPVRVSVGEPLTARFLGPTVEATSNGRTFVASRDIEVIIPPTKKVGRNHTDMEVFGDDGSSVKALLPWLVEPPIVASPPGLVLFADEGIVRKSIRLKSRRGPFRIVDVASDLLEGPCSPSGEDLEVHQISVSLDPSRAARGSNGSIRVRVDGPDLPEVVISLLVLDRRQGGK